MEAREQGCPAGGDSGIEGSRVALSSLSTGMYVGWIIQAVCTARRRHCYRVLWHTEGFNPITLALHLVIIRTSEKNYSQDINKTWFRLVLYSQVCTGGQSPLESILQNRHSRFNRSRVRRSIPTRQQISEPLTKSPAP
jgi:hypothetical protein